jgi:flagellar basal-body rod protein FlgG
MIRSLYTAATGMIAQQMQIDVTSNNIANVNTIGYKKQRAEFACTRPPNMPVPPPAK